MIGKVTTDDFEFTLEDDGSITSSDPDVRRVMAQAFQMYADDYSPAMGAFGVGWLESMANKLGGKATIQPIPPGSPDVIS